MAEDLLSERVSDIHRQLLHEFGSSISSDTIDRCLTETIETYRSARIQDFVPLFVQRDVRARLVLLMIAESSRQSISTAA